MSRADADRDRRLAQALIVDEYGPDDVDLLEWMARTSRACDDRRPCRRGRAGDD